MNGIFCLFAASKKEKNLLFEPPKTCLLSIYISHTWDLSTVSVFLIVNCDKSIFVNQLRPFYYYLFKMRSRRSLNFLGFFRSLKKIFWLEYILKVKAQVTLQVRDKCGLDAVVLRLVSQIQSLFEIFYFKGKNSK